MLPRPQGTLIVLPAFNEEASVGPVLQEIQRAMPGVPCLVVDDGSTDATAERARAAGATVLQLPFNLGVGGAMRAGFRYAEDEGYRTVVQLDADGQHDPAEVPELIAALGEADIAIGARFAGKGSYSTRGPRRWAMLVLSRVISGISRTRLTDTTSGFKANGPRAIALFAQHYPAEYLGDTVEALVIAARAGLRIRQVPVAMRPRQGGEPSHRPVKAAVYLVRAFVALGFALLRPRVIIPESGGSR
ncbi:glycosyltransferase involved in cell wall biosynthesis [Agromyces flavus]|uniref:Glycosyl transferase family 2 n=1 Tax=Agromyces flavus TaxID=589382 RepID=A0A1H1UHV5_9MICO|nr:glycosyltransferase family 2 protein [Agromyces flavus]MCP2368212.1 glycosyltransferase involved in cell wall biosynthesis [Agromyces flavus]GGI47672.1 glycosyl transferase family 2 [Agromyces flavus]SDS72063.1 Glycosyl transferase family 2 [Agromyces flavus]